jgi:hypothetical protein
MGEALAPAEIESDRGANLMNERRTKLEDGRYLIYYTFAGGREVEDSGVGVKAAHAPEAEHESAEGRSV